MLWGILLVLSLEKVYSWRRISGGKNRSYVPAGDLVGWPVSAGQKSPEGGVDIVFRALAHAHFWEDILPAR